jgi:hypothetical protein
VVVLGLGEGGSDRKVLQSLILVFLSSFLASSCLLVQLTFNPELTTAPRLPFASTTSSSLLIKFNQYS